MDTIDPKDYILDAGALKKFLCNAQLAKIDTTHISHQDALDIIAGDDYFNLEHMSSLAKDNKQLVLHFIMKGPAFGGVLENVS